MATLVWAENQFGVHLSTLDYTQLYITVFSLTKYFIPNKKFAYHKTQTYFN